MANSTRRAAARKTRDEFPLRVHKASDQWTKRIRGKVYYFGKRANDPKGTHALAEYHRLLADLDRSAERRDDADVTLRELCNAFLADRESQVETGELSPLSFGNYRRVCQLMLDVLGDHQSVGLLRPVDFRRLRDELAKGRSLATLTTTVTMLRVVFRFAYDAEMIANPVRFGKEFDAPSRRNVRKQRQQHKAKHGLLMFDADQVRRLLAAADQPMRSMILLGLNCGFGNTDIGRLPLTAIDLDGGWVEFPRPKTGVDRRIPLWAETVESTREWLAMRRPPKDDRFAHTLFLTSVGKPWVRSTDSSPNDSLSPQFARMLRNLDMKRQRVNFYGLRHTFATVGSETCDGLAVAAIMGHRDNSQTTHYVERISDERLIRVTEHVRAWLFADDGSTDRDGQTESTAEAPVVESVGDDEPVMLRLFAGEGGAA